MLTTNPTTPPPMSTAPTSERGLGVLFGAEIIGTNFTGIAAGLEPFTLTDPELLE